MKNPYMPLWVDDFIRGTKLMELDEKGLYICMIMELWVEGELPDDDKKLAKILGVEPRTFRRVWAKIRDKFAVGNGKVTHNRVTSERQRMISKSEINAINGKKGGLAKANATANATNSLERKGSHINPDSDSDINPEDKIIKAPNPVATHRTGPKKPKYNPQTGLLISKAINAHSEALTPESSNSSPNVKSLLKALIAVSEIKLDYQRLLAYIIQAKEAQNVKDRVGLCIKLIKDPKYAAADNCMEKAKHILDGWIKTNPVVSGMSPDLRSK